MKQRSLSNLHARWHHHLEPLKKKGLFWQEVVHSHHHYRIRITYRENVKANLRMNGLTSLEKTSFWHWRLSRLLSSFNAQKLATRGVLILQESFFAVIIRKIKGVRQLIKIKIFKSRSYCRRHEEEEKKLETRDSCCQMGWNSHCKRITFRVLYGSYERGSCIENNHESCQNWFIVVAMMWSKLSQQHSRLLHIQFSSLMRNRIQSKTLPKNLEDFLAKELEEDRHESNLEFGVEKGKMNWNWRTVNWRKRDFIGKMELITVDCVAMAKRSERIRAETLSSSFVSSADNRSFSCCVPKWTTIGRP